jgi:N-acetylglucosaminyldiphosphoundecaprenol N-acetyl-beta-D-mannosaminyltransferase
MMNVEASEGSVVMHSPVWVWGLPLSRATKEEAVDRVARMVRERRPSYFITANTHYAMLSSREPRLQAFNHGATFIVADGAPLVWASKLVGMPLPERVAGSDMIFDLCEMSAREGFRVFLLGAPPGVAENAAAKLVERYPGLLIAGIECPPYRDLTPEENSTLINRVRASKPDLLFLAFSQPKGEFWLSENLEALGVPVTVQIGASFDFVSGRVQRAPRRLQKLGLEWAFRTWLEPRRLVPRYTRNALFMFRMVGRDLLDNVLGRRSTPAPPTPPTSGDLLAEPDSTRLQAPASSGGEPHFEASPAEIGGCSQPAGSLN